LIAWSNSVLRNASGTVEYVLGTGIDITERRRAEEEIRATNQELIAINDIVVACTTRLELQPLLERVLDEALAIAGLEGGTLCLVQPDQTLSLAAHRATSEAIRQDLNQNKIQVGQCLCGNSAKEDKPLILWDRQAVLEYASREASRNETILFHAAFPLMTQGRCHGVLCVFTRTERKPAKRRLKLLETVTSQVAMAIHNALLYQETVHHAEILEVKVHERTAQLEAANQELEAFSYSVSHDLKAPLRHVTGFVDLIRDRLGPNLDDESRRLLDIIWKAAAKMGQLVEDLLLFSRMGRTAIRPLEIDSNSLVGEILREIKRDNPERQIKWQVVSLPVVRADLSLLRQVWVNLLENAVKYTRLQEQARIEIGWERGENEEPIFWVRDNGVGFDMQYADKLYGVFQRLHPDDQFEGTGIGLANVRRIIHRHGGRTWAQATAGHGATFFFSLPKVAVIPSLTP
jgi:signal transduction histidine kinase